MVFGQRFSRTEFYLTRCLRKSEDRFKYPSRGFAKKKGKKLIKSEWSKREYLNIYARGVAFHQGNKNVSKRRAGLKCVVETP